MKKKISLVLLLIAVVAGMAFALDFIRSIPFSQNVFDEEDVTVRYVWEEKTGISVEYEGNKTMPVGKMFLVGVFYKDGSYQEVYNNESLIGKGKIYILNLKFPNPSNIKEAYVWVAFGKKDIENYRNPPANPGWSIGDTKKSSKDKKTWIDRMFPPLKLK